MSKTIEAVYEQGVLRPLQPLQLPEGARLDIILLTDGKAGGRMSPADILAEIAVLPTEAATDPFSARDHGRSSLPTEIA